MEAVKGGWNTRGVQGAWKLSRQVRDGPDRRRESAFIWGDRQSDGDQDELDACCLYCGVSMYHAPGVW